MKCKVCGRPNLRRLCKDYFLINYVGEGLAGVTELLCWTCRYWLQTGKTYDVR